MRNHKPYIVHVIQLAMGASMSSLGVNGRTKSWEAHQCHQQFGENESTDIEKNQRMQKEGNARINKVTAMRPGQPKIMFGGYIYLQYRHLVRPETWLFKYVCNVSVGIARNWFLYFLVKGLNATLPDLVLSNWAGLVPWLMACRALLDFCITLSVHLRTGPHTSGSESLPSILELWIWDVFSRWIWSNEVLNLDSFWVPHGVGDIDLSLWCISIRNLTLLICIIVACCNLIIDDSHQTVCATN